MTEADIARSGTPGGWWARVGAALLDTAFVFCAVVGTIGVGFAAAAVVGDAVLIPSLVAAIAVWLFYSPFLMQRPAGRNGQTWGRQITGVRVVPASRGRMTFGRAFVREFVVKTALFGWAGGVIVIGYLLDVLWPLWDSENRALHDMLVATRVVRA